MLFRLVFLAIVSGHHTGQETPSCISPSLGFAPQSFAEPCDWPSAENVRFSGPYAILLTGVNLEPQPEQPRRRIGFLP